jgi:hypothetical protein
MPFYNEIKVPELLAGSKYTFVKWVLSGRLVIEANTALAIVRSGEN